MAMKTKAAIFLNGAYPPDHSYFYINEYKKAGEDSVVITVDGGLQFFLNHKLNPDLIIGDWDSADLEIVKSYPKAVTIGIPAEGKDYTDTELALEWCVKNNIEDVILYGGVDNTFETDQLLGNICLLFAYKDKLNSIKMLDYCQEILPFVDEEISGIGKAGDMISVVPMADQITLSGDGLAYDPGGKVYKFGQTTSMRNQLIGGPFSFKVKGRAALIRHF